MIFCYSTSSRIRAPTNLFPFKKSHDVSFTTVSLELKHAHQDMEVEVDSWSSGSKHTSDCLKNLKLKKTYTSSFTRVIETKHLLEGTLSIPAAERFPVCWDAGRLCRGLLGGSFVSCQCGGVDSSVRQLLEYHPHSCNFPQQKLTGSPSWAWLQSFTLVCMSWVPYLG